MMRQLPSHNLHYHEGCIASDAPDLLLKAFLYVHKSWQGDCHSETPLWFRIPPYNHVRNYTFPSLIHCLVDAYTVITVDIYFSCITSIRYLCASVADKGSEGLCAVCIMAKIMNSENHASSCRCKTDGLFASNTSSVCPERIICFLQTHHPFSSNVLSFCFSLFYAPSPAFSLPFRASSFLFWVAR